MGLTRHRWPLWEHGENIMEEAELEERRYGFDELGLLEIIHSQCR